MTFLDLDVRPMLKAGGEPLSAIMATVARLGPGDGLRLLAPFKPTPLFAVLASKGFMHEEHEIEGGDWQVLFMPTDNTGNDASPLAANDGRAAWSNPTQELDTRHLDSPEPMIDILAAIEAMGNGEVLSALLTREPLFLFPELARHGHAWRGGFEPDGTTYRLLVRVSAGPKTMR